MDSARRNFLRARTKPAETPVRPPWAIAEADFMHQCSRCGDCIRACAASGSGLLQAGDGAYPVAAFGPANSAICTFCGDCLRACEQTASGALDRRQPARLPVIHIGTDCLPHQQVVCRSCGEHCDAGAIRFRPRPGGVALPQLDTDACNGCGACLPVCPTQAIDIRATTSLSSLLAEAS